MPAIAAIVNPATTAQPRQRPLPSRVDSVLPLLRVKTTRQVATLAGIDQPQDHDQYRDDREATAHNEEPRE